MSCIDYCKENIHSRYIISDRDVVLECDDYGPHKEYKTLNLHIDGKNVGTFVVKGGGDVDHESLGKKVREIIVAKIIDSISSHNP